jgi:hypothetical protein
MLATSVTYDLFFVLHLAAAVVSLVVFIVLRSGARAVALGAPAERQRRAFPERRNIAARVFHLVPVTGVVMAAIGSSSVSFARPWVSTGLVIYVLAAGHLEARTLPAERRLASQIAASGTASPAEGKRFTLSVDILLGLVAVALVAMVSQF